MGGPNVAINGKLVIMASGKKEVFEKFKTVFDSIAEQSFYLGGTGTAHSIKLAMNLQIANACSITFRRNYINKKGRI